jgi:hypothetical protein
VERFNVEFNYVVEINIDIAGTKRVNHGEKP